MAKKASNAKLMKETYMFFAVVFVVFLAYGIVGLNLAMVGGMAKSTYLCLDLPIDEFKPRKGQTIFNAFTFFLSMGSGIFFDYKLFLFVKNRNKTQDVELVPWKSVNPKAEESDLQIPLRATIISSILMFFSWILFLTYLLTNNFWNIPVVLSLYSNILLPLILVFSIKKKNSDKKPSQPPQGLQFHNENFSEGISHPLQYHEDFVANEEILEEGISEDHIVNVAVERNVIVNPPNHPIPSPRLIQTSAASNVMILNAKTLSNSQINQDFDRIDVLSLTEIEC